MKKLFNWAITVVLLATSSMASAVEYVDAKPLKDVVNATVQDCSNTSPTNLHDITWGADIATVLANGNNGRTQKGSIFAKAGLDFNIVRQDDFVKQAESYLKCDSPYVRGTNGMIQSLAELANADPRTKLIFINQLSWSAARPGEKWGGDALVVKEHVKKISDIKTISKQVFGPHGDFATVVFDTEGKSLDQVKVKWTKGLVGFDGSTPGAAFENDPEVDAAFVILPDALAMTANGTVCDGEECNNEGARIYMTSKSANRAIADVWAVRADYFNANRDEVMKFVNAYWQAQERLEELAKDMKSGAFIQTMTAAADILVDSPNPQDAIDLYLGAEFTGFAGNVEFFGNPNNLRNFERVTDEAQSSLIALGLLSRKVPVEHAKWDYDQMKTGLKNTAGVAIPKFNKAKLAALVTEREQKGTSEEGELFHFPIYFEAKQTTFPASQYGGDFDKALKMLANFSGSPMVVEGHSDPNKYLSNKKKGKDTAGLQKDKQGLKNMSIERAQTVVSSIIDYADAKGITLSEEQFDVRGVGIMKPNTPGCTYDSRGDIAMSCKAKNKQQWIDLNGNRRVRFSLIEVETESAEWE